MNEKIYRVLKSGHIGDDVANDVASKFKPVSKRSDILLPKGRVANKIFFIDSGFVVLTSEINGQLFTRHIAKENDFITVMESFTTREPSKDMLRATKHAEIHAIGYNALMALMDKHPVLEGLFRQILQNTLIKCQARINDLLSLSAEAYYEKLIRESPYILQAIPQYELSTYLGIASQSLSRIKKKLLKLS
ncbi:Crp/Fnr family transcriptional regulator [Parapedobacter tibetensis]|uniref:Crp/Fnr family transcriptional regulator n=1 Tax=Parapedobacter tibetensis TaxID=2972951 RepID=UPI00214D7839|nr:hypothetical protein [Parapedobacter tibetensis]